MGKTTTGGHPERKMVNPGAAATDIGSTMHMAAVNPDSTDLLTCPQIVPRSHREPAGLCSGPQP